MAVLGHRGWKLTAAAFGVFMVASVVTSCSSSSDSGGGGITPTATIFVQNFKYNGVPATVSTGINTFLFQNQESFEITHEMIPIAVAGGEDRTRRDRRRESERTFR